MILQLRLYRLLLRTSTYALPVVAYGMGWWVWIAFQGLLNRPAFPVPNGHINQMLFGMLVWALVAERCRVSILDEILGRGTVAKNAWFAALATLAILLTVLVFTRNKTFPPSLVVCDIVVLLALTALLHALVRFTCRWRRRRPLRLLIIGADEFAASVAARLQKSSFHPYEIAGFVRLPDQHEYPRARHIYDLKDLETLTSEDGFDEAVIAVQPAEIARLPEIIAELDRLCLPARAVVDLEASGADRERLFQLGRMQVLDLAHTPVECLGYALLKKIFDLVFASAVLLLTSPLFALIAALIKISSPGPVFFAQERVGLNGKPFRMYKFRSMQVAARREGDTVWTTNQDPRRTSVGKFLRKTSLDELPQFINVLKGEMSVVGPRPERPYFVHKFLQEITQYNRRHALKVGITGWAQVNGWRGDTSIEKRVEYDLYYLQNWSFIFDLQIIAMTIKSGLMAKNAY